MKVPAFYNNHTPPAIQAGSARKVLQNAQNERTAGFMPAWVKAEGQSSSIEDVIAAALNEPAHETPQGALAYNAAPTDPKAQKEFGFGDLLDMINPLQHLPVIGHLYREFTGDTIRPISQIMGGAVFGGPLGAAGGIVNAIAQEETGKDVTGNALTMVQGAAPKFKPQTDALQTQNLYDNDAIGQLLALTDLKSNENIQIIRQADANQNAT